MAACMSCGTSNPDGFRFCGACAEPLVAAVPAIVREERKTVTILFADLAGFTSRSETLDPEDVRAFLVPYYDALTTEITGHGGRVDRFLGDGIMALFGAPVAHEDDPDRAVRAALRIVERVPALGLDLHVRVGINTGPVLFVPAEGGRDDAVTGDAVNTAARLQAAAPTDGVVVGEATYRATSHLFRFEALEPIRAKGKAEPVPLWRPLERVARPAGELRPENTPFVGRAFELELLVHLFERARSTSKLEVVTVVADPGFGKSRLVRELARYVDALPDLVTWRVGRCLPYGDGISFWALGEIIKAQTGILDTDDQVTLSAKLEAVLKEPDPQLRAWIKDRVGPLVGLETATAPPQREEVFTAWRRFLESIAQAGPTVLIVEDLHWADDALVAFLGHLAANSSRLPLLLVVTARPEVEERHPAWLGRARRSTVVSLDALNDLDMTALVQAALPGASAGLLAAVLDRAAGSPLYGEQIAAMYGDRLMPDDGVSLDETAVPATIAALLAARIDALPPDAKAVLLDASVVGKTFWSSAVVALGSRPRSEIEPLLADLARRELVRPALPAAMAGEATYTFVHALLRDVAYGELPRGARLARHRATAAWITNRAGAALGEDAEIVIAHLERALELATVTGAAGETDEIQVGLVDALLVAADNAMRTDVPRAVVHLRRALDIVDADDPRRPTMLARLGWAQVTMSHFREAAGVFEEARGELLRRRDHRLAAEIAAPMAVALTNAGLVSRASEILEDAREVLSVNPGAPLLAIMAEQAYAAFRAFRLDLAHRLGHETVVLAESLGLPPPPRALMVRGRDGDVERAIEVAEAAGDLRTKLNGLTVLGERQADTGESVAILDGAIAFAQAHGLPDVVQRRVQFESVIQAGRTEGVMDGLIELERRSRELGDTFNVVLTEFALIDLRLELGEPVESVDHLAAAWREVGTSFSDLGLLQARVELANGRRFEAARRLAEALEQVEDGEDVRELVALVEACLRAGEPALARQAIAQARSPAQRRVAEYDRRFSDAEDEAAAGLVAEADGDLPAARAAYERALSTFAGLGMVREHASVLGWLGRCLLAIGETEEGVARLREARATFASMGAKPRLAEVDALLSSVGLAPDVPGSRSIASPVSDRQTARW